MFSDGNNQFPEAQQETLDTNEEELLQDSEASSNQTQNNHSIDDQEKKIDSDDELDTENSDDLPSIGDETLIDMFSYYFIKYKEEKDNSSPSPSYFNYLSDDEKNLLRIFKQYYTSYKLHH